MRSESRIYLMRSDKLSPKRCWLSFQLSPICIPSNLHFPREPVPQEGYCCQRLCLRSGGLLKPRHVSVGKLYKIYILNTLMSRHHCVNILLAAAALLKFVRYLYSPSFAHFQNPIGRSSPGAMFTLSISLWSLSLATTCKWYSI